MFSENQEALLRLKLSTWLGSSTSRCAVVQGNSYHGNHALNFLVIDTDAVWTESKVATFSKSISRNSDLNYLMPFLCGTGTARRGFHFPSEFVGFDFDTGLVNMFSSTLLHEL